MSRYYVYVLESMKDRKLYIGTTGDLNKRLCRHNTGKVPSTKTRCPFILVHAEESNSRKDALRREKYLKSLKSSKYIRKYILRPDSSAG